MARTKKELKIAEELRKKIKQLRKINYPEKDIEKVIKKLDLPLGLQLNLLGTR